MQISTESNTEISENMSKNNYNNKNMWIKMMSENDMSAILFETKYNQKSFINE